jgi:hypothetical protein
MFHHVGEWSRVVARDYRHHPLVSIFTSALMIPLSHCLALHRDLVQGHRSCRCPPASSHRAPFMISFSFHAATEHSEFDSLVMYARRKIVSVFVPGTSRAVPILSKMVPAGIVCLTVPRYVVCVYVLMSRYPRGSSLSISICTMRDSRNHAQIIQ